MKKSILFGALAFFAISVLGIQDATAQTVDTKNKKSETTLANPKKEKPDPTNVDKTTTTTATTTTTKEQKACCAEKKDCSQKDCDRKNAKNDPKANASVKKGSTKADKDVMKPSTKNEAKKAKKGTGADR